MLVDVCIGFNETDIFELRYHTLKDVVDLFIVVEHNVTFRGQPKPYFLNQRYRAAMTDPQSPDAVTWGQMYGRVHWSTIRATPQDRNPWVCEHAQRNGAWIEAQRVAESHQYPSSGPITYLWSDLDEIPSPDAIREALQLAYPLIGFRQDMCYGSFAYHDVGGWVGTRMFKPQLYGAQVSGQELRTMAVHHTMDNGGWHCSYFGGADSIRQKLAAYSHQEWDTPEGYARLLESFSGGVNPFSRDRFQPYPRKRLPPYVWTDPARWGLQKEEPT